MSERRLKIAVPAQVLDEDIRAAAVKARQLGVEGLEVSAYTARMRLPDLSATGRREFRHVLAGQQRELAAVHVDCGPRGLGPGADVDRVINGVDKAMEVARGLAAQLRAWGTAVEYVSRFTGAWVVCIDGFIIQNSRTGSMRDFAGVRLSKVQNVTVSNNTLLNNFFGIYLSDSNNIRVINNHLSGSNNAENSGNGIHLWKCKYVLISGNYVTHHRDGIYFEFAKNSTIENNVSEKNIRYGLHFMFSDDDTYLHNTFRNNGSGVAVMYTRRIKMLNNTFTQNWGGSIYGLLLKEISDAQIEGNQFIRNTTGIYMENTERIRVTKNNFRSNGWAVRVLASCYNNYFTNNNFEGNSFDATTNGSLKENYFSNNYWDKYEGYDLDKNGIGDVPYRPISLYAQVIEQNPQSVMLMRSFIVNLMDKVERAVPSVTPETVKDEKPMMKPWKR